MSITAALVILGCLVAGYWIVSSIMEPGIDVTDEAEKSRETGPRRQPQAGPRATPRAAPAPARPSARPAVKPAATTAGARPGADSPMADWYVVLDVEPGASRREIQAAVKRRLAQAEAANDQAAAARIRRAGTAGLSAAGRPRS